MGAELGTVEAYSLYTVGQASGGVLIPVNGGVAAMDGEHAEVIAVVDDPFPYGKNADGSPVYPTDMGWALDQFYPFLANCQYRVNRLAEYSVRPYPPAYLRPGKDKADAPHWLDARPYHVLLQPETDHLVGIHYNDAAYVLIVRNGTVVAGVWEAELPTRLPDAGHCDQHVVNFERMLEYDESLQASAFQQAFDYAGRIYDRSSSDGKAQAGVLFKKLEPIWQYYGRVAADRAVGEQLKRGH